MPEIPIYEAPASTLKIDLALKREGDYAIEHAAEQTRQVAHQTAQLGRQRGQDLDRGFKELGAGFGGIAEGLKKMAANQATDEIASQTRLLSNWQIQMEKDYQTQVGKADPSDSQASQRFFQQKLEEFDKLPQPTTPAGREHWEAQRANILSHLQNRAIQDDGTRVKANVASAVSDSATSLVARAKDDPTDMNIDALLKEHANNTNALINSARQSGVDPMALAKVKSESTKVDQDIIENAFKARLMNPKVNPDDLRGDIPGFVKKYGEKLGVGEADLNSMVDEVVKIRRGVSEGYRLDKERQTEDHDKAVIDETVKTMYGGTDASGALTKGSLGKALEYVTSQITAGNISGQKGEMIVQAIQRQIKLGEEGHTDQGVIAEMTQKFSRGEVDEGQVWAKVGLREGGYTARDAESILSHGHKEAGDLHILTTYQEAYKGQFRNKFGGVIDFTGTMKGNGDTAYADWLAFETDLHGQAMKQKVTEAQFWQVNGPWRKQLDEFRDQIYSRYGVGEQGSVANPDNVPSAKPLPGRRKWSQDEVNAAVSGKRGTPPVAGFDDGSGQQGGGNAGR